MKMVFSLLVSLLSLMCFAEPEEISPAEKLEHIKTALGCKVQYEMFFRPFVISLTPEQEQEALGILAQLQPAGLSEHIDDGHAFSYEEDMVYTQLICTAADGVQYSVYMDDIGFVDGARSVSECTKYELPDEKSYLRLRRLVDFENHKGAITEKNRAFMAEKAQALSYLRRASKCRLISRSNKGEEVLPLSSEEEREILSILPRLQLAPAEAVIEEDIRLETERFFIFTCGDKEVELKPYYIRSACESYMWDSSPYMLDSVSYARLHQLARENSFRATDIDISVGDKLHVETLKRAAAHTGYTVNESDAKNYMRQIHLPPTRILSLSKESSRQEAQFYLNPADEVYAIFLTEKNTPPNPVTDKINHLYIDPNTIYISNRPIVEMSQLPERMAVVEAEEYAVVFFADPLIRPDGNIILAWRLVAGKAPELIFATPYSDDKGVDYDLSDLRVEGNRVLGHITARLTEGHDELPAILIDLNAQTPPIDFTSPLYH